MMIAEILLHKINSGENLSQGSGRFDGQFFVGSFFRKNAIAENTWIINIIFAKQISDNLQGVRDQNHLVGYMHLPITASSIKP